MNIYEHKRQQNPACVQMQEILSDDPFAAGNALQNKYNIMALSHNHKCYVRLLPLLVTAWALH